MSLRNVPIFLLLIIGFINNSKTFANDWRGRVVNFSDAIEETDLENLYNERLYERLIEKLIRTVVPVKQKNQLILNDGTYYFNLEELMTIYLKNLKKLERIETTNAFNLHLEITMYSMVRNLSVAYIKYKIKYSKTTFEKVAKFLVYIISNGAISDNEKIKLTAYPPELKEIALDYLIELVFVSKKIFDGTNELKDFLGLSTWFKTQENNSLKRKFEVLKFLSIGSADFKEFIEGRDVDLIKRTLRDSAIFLGDLEQEFTSTTNEFTAFTEFIDKTSPFSLSESLQQEFEEIKETFKIKYSLFTYKNFVFNFEAPAYDHFIDRITALAPTYAQRWSKR